MGKKSNTRRLWTNIAYDNRQFKTEIKISEHQHQKTFCKYCELKNIPVFAIPNSQALSFLNRDAARNAMIKLKHEGLRPGIPDLFIPIPTKKHHGMFIEMKTKGGSTNTNQDYWLKKLKELGYETVICYSSDEAQDKLKEYLTNNS